MDGPIAVGAYQTAAELSPNKGMIDTWLNEGKSAMWISKKLKETTGEYISDKGINKYKKYREEAVQTALEKDPIYQNQIQVLNDQLMLGIGKIRHVDVIAKLADTIEQSAELLNDAMGEDGITIKNAQDYKFVAETMLNAIKIYGDTVLKAQRFKAVENDPSLLKPTTINVNIKSALADVLKGVINGNGGFDVIDKLRRGLGHTDGTGYNGDIVDDRSSVLDGDTPDIEGEGVLIQG